MSSENKDQPGLSEPAKGALIKAEIGGADVWALTTSAPKQGKVKAKVIEVISELKAAPAGFAPGSTTTFSLHDITRVKQPRVPPPGGRQSSFVVYLSQGRFRRMARVTGSGHPVPVKLVDVSAEYLSGCTQKDEDFTADFLVGDGGMVPVT